MLPNSVAVNRGKLLLTAAQQYGSALKEYLYPLLPSSVALHYSSTTAHCSLAVW